MDILNLKQEIFEKAKQEGFEECEIFYYSSQNISVSVFKGELEKFQNNTLGGLSFRGIFNGNMGYSYTEKIDLTSIESLVSSAKENAKIITSKDEEFIFSGSESYPEVKTFYEELENIEVDEMIEKCLQMEKEVLNFDSLITSCNSCSISKSYSETLMANTKGLSLQNKSNLFVSYVSAVAKKDEQAKSFGDVYIGYDFNDFDHINLARKVAKNAISYLGAKSKKSGSYKTVIENECFADLLEAFVPNFYAENVQKGFSLLKGKLEKSIASSKITILDNPLLEQGYSSTPFDSEGVASFNKTVVENGILKTYLYNLKSAKKDNVKSTGNGFKSSYKSSTSTDTTNFYIQNGDCSFEEMLKQVGDGILITNLSGLHSGTNSISGDFSLLAEGFLIENGKISSPLEQITIADNFYDILGKINIVANDLKFNTSSIGSPTVYVGETSISGN